MSTSAFYESQAARCREYAAKSRDAGTIKPGTFEHRLQLALEYDQLAGSMVSVPQVSDGAHQVPQQEIQQQQSKSESDKD